MTQINEVQKRKSVMQTKKIHDTRGLVKKQTIMLKLLKQKKKIPSTSGLATSAALTAVDNKITNVSTLVKKQIMTQKCYILNLSILLQLIKINLQVKHMMQR